MTVVRIDLDIDTANQRGTSEPSRTLQEDDVEEVVAKIIQMNDFDADGDFIPDFLDGFSLFSGTVNDNEIENGRNFYPLVFEVAPYSDAFLIQFDYSCPSDPRYTVISTLHAAALTQTNSVSGNPLGSGIRIWRKDESEERNPAPVSLMGDFVKPGEMIALCDIVSGNNTHVSLFVEGIETSPSWSDQHIEVTIFDKNGHKIVADKVAYCVVRCSFQICVYRPYTFDGTNRHEFCANYQTPRTMFDSYCQGLKQPDDKYHKDADFMGHAFARIQSRTPSENIDIWTGQTEMDDKKILNPANWSVGDVLSELRRGTIFWYSFPDGKQNTQDELQLPWDFFLGKYDDGFLVAFGGGRRLRLTAAIEYRIRPDTSNMLQRYISQHNFRKYGLDATINNSHPRCGCGSYIAILAQRSVFGKFNSWIVNRGMPVIPLPSCPSSIVGVGWDLIVNSKNEIIDNCNMNFQNSSESASWNTSGSRSLRFADPGLMAGWIDARNGADGTVNQRGRTKQSIILQHIVPPQDDLADWDR